MMDDAELAKILAEHADEDVLTDRGAELSKFYDAQSCPKCGGKKLSRSYDTRHAFSDPSEPLPRALLDCTECGAHWDPHSGIRLVEGNLGRVPVPDVLVKPKP